MARARKRALIATRYHVTAVQDSLLGLAAMYMTALPALYIYIYINSVIYIYMILYDFMIYIIHIYHVGSPPFVSASEDECRLPLQTTISGNFPIARDGYVGDFPIWSIVAYRRCTRVLFEHRDLYRTLLNRSAD